MNPRIEVPDPLAHVVISTRAKHSYHVLAEELEDGRWISWCGLFIAANRQPLPKALAMAAPSLLEMPCPVCRRCWKALEQA